MSVAVPTVVAAFAGGLLTAASPCVLAAVPVAVGYVGGRAMTARHGWLLSASLVAGMTAALTVLGLVAAQLGVLMGSLPGAWTAAAGLLVAVAGVMVGWGPRRANTLPSALQQRLLGSGVPGAVLLGALLGTVMTPCATPALAAALAIAGSSGMHEASAWQGAALLGAYGLGHSALLLIAGASPQLAAATARHTQALRWLPGRQFFGLLVIGSGLWLAAAGLG